MCQRIGRVSQKERLQREQRWIGICKRIGLRRGNLKRGIGISMVLQFKLEPKWIQNSNVEKAHKW